jgi:hypothetical protein
VAGRGSESGQYLANSINGQYRRTGSLLTHSIQGGISCLLTVWLLTDVLCEPAIDEKWGPQGSWIHGAENVFRSVGDGQIKKNADEGRTTGLSVAVYE